MGGTGKQQPAIMFLDKAHDLLTWLISNGKKPQLIKRLLNGKLGWGVHRNSLDYVWNFSINRNYSKIKHLKTKDY